MEGSDLNEIDEKDGFAQRDRITRFDADGGSTDSAIYGYDSNGNGSFSSVRFGASTTNRDYLIDAASNRALGFTQRIGAATTSVSYAYNATGDLTSDGLRTFSYNAEGRLSAVTTGATDASPTTRYAHNALGQRVFKTEPLYLPAQGDEANPGFMQTLVNFFAQLWQPAASVAEKMGTAYVYDENASLIYEAGTGGANSTGSTRHIYLRTANGPMPIVAVVNGNRFAVSSDHLNTPRRITNDQGQVVWQWAYSAFGDNKPTLAKNRFADPEITPNAGTTNIAALDYNIGYWGMYRDKESGLFYNYFRTYKPDFGYTQNDPIGLFGGPNRKTPLANNPLSFSDPFGLDVYLCSQPAFGIPWNPIDHHWLKTDTVEAGMGGIRGNVPGNDFGDMPGDPVQVIDHGKRSTEPGASCKKIEGVDEQKVNEALRFNRPLGRWGPTNQCQSFARQTLLDAGWKPTPPRYISKPLPAFGF